MGGYIFLAILFMAILNISWEEYHKKTEQLAVKVYDDGWKFNQVVCNRGLIIVIDGTCN